MWKPTVAAIGALVALGGTAAADFSASATADLNIRSGPGPQYPVVGVIAANDTANVGGCIQGSKWCSVAYNGVQGWAYSEYLTAPFSGQQIVVAQPPASFEVPTVTYDGPSAAVPGAVTGATIGAIVGGPIGAAVGGVIGATAGAVVDPPNTVRTYVASNPVEPVYLQGEVVVGATLPQTIQVMPVPDYRYGYVYVNGQGALVDPTTHRIVYVFRS